MLGPSWALGALDLCDIEDAADNMEEALAMVDTDDNTLLAEQLLDWLRRWPHPVIGMRDILQRAVPRLIRKREIAEPIVAVLERDGRLVRMPEGTSVAGHRRQNVWRIVGRQDAATPSVGSAISTSELIQPSAATAHGSKDGRAADVQRPLVDAVARISLQRPPDQYGVSDYRWARFGDDGARLVDVWAGRILATKARQRSQQVDLQLPKSAVTRTTVKR